MAIQSSTIRALIIIRDIEITMPSQFGRLLWPDHPGWSRLGKCGHGSGRGVGMRLAAGGFLGKLEKQGLIRSHWRSKNVRYWTVTTAGLFRLLEESM